MTLKTKVGGTALATALALTLASCASDAPNPTLPKAATTRSVAPAATPSQNALAPKIGKPFIDAATAKKFGDADVQAAWDYTTAIAAEYAFNPTLMDTTPTQLTRVDFATLRAEMTPAALADFDKSVDSLPTTQSVSNINGLALQGMHDGGYAMNQTRPLSDYAITGQAQTHEDGRLALAQTQKATIHMVDSKGSGIKFTTTKHVSYLVKKVGGDWKLDGWISKGENSDITPDT